MALQGRNCDLYYDGDIEKEIKSHHLAEQCGSVVSVGSSEYSSCAKISPPSSFNNGLRRSTFDLTSFDTLATSCSDSSGCYSSPIRTSPTLRYRGRQSPSSSSQNHIYTHFREGAATQALLQLAAKSSALPPLQEVREESRTVARPLDKTKGDEGLCSPKISTGYILMPETIDSNDCDDNYGSIMSYILEGILLGHIILPLLHFTIIIERRVRSFFWKLRCTIEFHFPILSAPSSTFQQEPINFEGKELCSLLASSYMKQESIEDNEDTCCYSSSSSSSDDENIERDQDEWGHFKDFRDELADESSFVPSCTASPLPRRPMATSALSPSCIATLEALTEGQEEDDEVREDWSF
uniref:Uncharacterized protein n=1 Tax=Pseudo-nitzschia australis TaxID=44445 RepID=A0A7S4ANN2_9STRA|mmetsp:Transcript_16289/g.35369  ORF Transcript_16289/g.35369 Transcript_16289/m.35369 type:complete len:353 (-) Transcript_16289:1385-2443(-)|eukprot:CAMPEP_0168170736 /NCGR_PEP_ID=MMETSP0139_2-20121125/4342_1 /TAXON_ID=44445 /ORGANISM="Pseudo-nitzschia australis, Strain 10249 10 AB" /LENGTH=352 /DNA_ID=CAMNT_0008088265 /DNA_START=133 /DNA_END=1191 /DNA_ORIENTATION=-